MNRLASCLARVRDDLDDLGYPWALIGALGVAAYAEARATLDIDVAVAVDDTGGATALVKALVDRQYVWRSSFGHAMVSLEVPNGPEAELRLDLLFSLTGVEPEVARGAVRIPVLRDLVLPVGRRGDLTAIIHEHPATIPYLPASASFRSLRLPRRSDATPSLPSFASLASTGIYVISLRAS